MASDALWEIETPRLRIRPTSLTDARHLVDVYNSNPDFVDACEQFSGKRAYALPEVEGFLRHEIARENSHCLAIRLRDTGELAGTASLLVPHYAEPYPWIGLLLIHGRHQRRGIGTEAAGAIEEVLAREGWPEVRLGVMQSTPGSKRF